MVRMQNFLGLIMVVMSIGAAVGGNIQFAFIYLLAAICFFNFAELRDIEDRLKGIDKTLRYIELKLVEIETKASIMEANKK